MKIDEETFAVYAAQIEKDDFERLLYQASTTLKQVVNAREDTIDKLIAAAKYLDSLWLRCRVSRSLGSGVSMLGGGLTIVGGVMTAVTSGAAAPILIAGIATSSVGTAANVSTSLVEKIVNSSQMRGMNVALERDREISKKFDNELETLVNFKESQELESLLKLMKSVLGENHLLSATLETKMKPKSKVPLDDNCNADNWERLTLLQKGYNDGVEHRVLGPGVLMEGGKVIGQNSIRAAGQVVLGFSAAFLAWDTLDFGLNISQLVKQEGSEAARVLRSKAAKLESALQNTLSFYNVRLPD